MNIIFLKAFSIASWIAILFISFIFGFRMIKNKTKNKAYRITVLYVWIGVLLGLILLIMQILTIRILYHEFFASLYINLFVIIINSILLFLVDFSKESFLPYSEKQFITENHSKLKYYVLLISVILLLILIWLIYNLLVIESFPVGNQIANLSFIFMVFILFINLIKRITYYVNQTIEIVMDKQYTDEMLNFMQMIRSQRHDFNFHLQVITGLLENNKYVECNDYVKTMVVDMNDMNEVLPLYHPAIGALLNSFREMAATKGILLEITVHNNLENLPCNVYEANKIIGNLLQNAIDEVEQYVGENLWIGVMILKRSGNNVIKVSNKSYKQRESYKNIFKHGFTTKKCHEGIGLITVKKIVTKYNGVVYLELEEDMVHFIVKIPIDFV